MAKWRYKEPERNHLVRARLLDLGMKQGDLAEKTGYSQSAISQIMRGKSYPTREQCKDIAQVLETKPWELFPHCWGKVEE